jgi:PhzF family phenazine biosynthesis protein
MKLNLYQIDAFTDEIFGGNPACVVPLDYWLDDETLLNITKENAVAETAFFVDKGDKIHLRWFTPEIEMDLCGHATLATAHCLKTILNYKSGTIVFETLSGDLIVIVEQDLYKMDFPSRMPIASKLPKEIEQSLNIQPKEIYKSRDFVLVYENESQVRNINIDRQFFDQINLDPGGVIVTAVGEHCDFVSRFFTPQASILEDPVTGSAHCSLTPFWAARLGKKELTALQVSDRVGQLYCEDKEDRVIISGKAVTYSIGNFWLKNDLKKNEWINHPTILSGDVVELRPLEKEDLEELYRAASDKELWKYIPTDCSHRETFYRTYNTALEERNKGNHYPFVIHHKKTNKIIGSTRFFDIQPSNKKLEIGWTWIVKEYWGTKINFECKLLLLNYCFNVLKTRRVQLKTDATNLRSRKAIEKIGAQFEGILRKDKIKENGDSRSAVYYSIIDDEWPMAKENIIKQLNSNL